ncbi:hydrogen peroxide-inducible genes activator [Pseudaminobacter sp. 19-2017]|uniref:Hydrogen peroxide-inducible genes activator n=1 Tax=Pseudaminobacter soli (ex Zhang et al. 2022) TaxID=2831468 RepID=A0A942I2H9_9HYPH|nr:hydrogen peroxide-inducible genes activator [Pseudaminobacter soli]MBS3648409.1 hydrogen peroxide-inducible genes activator [Pseudaminobacter soli]
MITLSTRQMLYFDALARTRHFGQAAELVGVTQPALSSQIAEMEARLGCRLFERGGRSVRLTEEAVALQPRIEAILSQIREVEALARRGRLPMEGRFRLGMIPTIAPYLLPQLLSELKDRFPQLQVEMREAITDTLISETTAGRLDGFIAALPLDHSALETELLFQDRFFLAVPEHDAAFIDPPVAPESPALERLMLLEEGHCLRDQALKLCSHIRPTAMANYGATSLTTLLQMVGHGLGVTLLPEMAAEASRSIHDLKIVPFAEPAPSRQIALAWRRNGSRQEECREVAGIIRELSPTLFE